MKTPDLDAVLAQSPYQGYVYGYPHKTGYRTLAPAPTLQSLWETQDRSALFLYLHVPYCEMRCGFCNLFTSADRDAAAHGRYLDALAREAEAVSEALGDRTFARMAIGGGTPTLLHPEHLGRLLKIAADLGADPGRIPCGIETSPATASLEKLLLLKNAGVRRVSMGVQSFDADDCRKIGRPQDPEALRQALDNLKTVDFPVLNLDFIYGGEGQTPARWLSTLEEAVTHAPQEIYLYPLYVRPLTTLGKLDRSWDDQRLRLYRLGRDFLVSQGYRQVSMRQFAKPSALGDDPAYSCQEDGMVGVGCGARSYAGQIHYSAEYAVSQRGVQAILQDYATRDHDAFARAHHGIRLNAEEIRRRFLLLSLLQCEGVDLAEYRSRFQSEAVDDFPGLTALAAHGLADADADRLALTPAGIERSDAIGPWLFSDAVSALMTEYAHQ